MSRQNIRDGLRPFQYVLMANAPDKEDNEKDDKSRPVPPRAPDRTPVKEPEKTQEPMGDPQPPSKKKTRLRRK